MSDTRQAIERAVGQFTEAFRRGDSSAVAALYAGDARLMPPNHPKVEGTETIRSFWQGAMDMGIKEARIEIEDVEGHGDTAIEVGRYTLSIERGNGQRVGDAGKYVVVWKRGGDGWRMAVDIFNSDTPAPGR